MKGKEQTRKWGLKGQSVLHNSGGGVTRTSFKSTVNPIGEGPILFDIENLLKELGVEPNLLEKGESIFKVLYTQIPSEEKVDQRATSLPKFLISVLPQPQEQEREYCKDLELTLAILSRRTGKFFMASRKPDYSIGFLLEEKFRVDNF
jgi:hypothetical protein